MNSLSQQMATVLAQAGTLIPTAEPKVPHAMPTSPKPVNLVIFLESMETSLITRQAFK